MNESLTAKFLSLMPEGYIHPTLRKRPCRPNKFQILDHLLIFPIKIWCGKAN